MRNHLERIIDLVRRTGDKMVIVDKNDPESSVVVMNLDDYEILLDDVAYGDALSGWRSNTDDEPALPEEEMDEISEEIPMEDELPDFPEGASPAPENLPTDGFSNEETTEEASDLDNDSRYGTMDATEDHEANKPKKWQIPEEIKQGSGAVEEDRYYLESV